MMEVRTNGNHPRSSNVTDGIRADRYHLDGAPPRRYWARRRSMWYFRSFESFGAITAWQ